MIFRQQWVGKGLKLDMAQAQTTEVFNCTPEQFFNIVRDYEKYHEFLSEIKSCKILRDEGSKKLVEYKIQLIKEFKYHLWMSEAFPHTVSWEFASGDLFKTSHGYWKIEPEGHQSRVQYFLDAQFSLFVPGPIAKAAVNVNLPNMMSSYHKRVEDLYGRR